MKQTSDADLCPALTEENYRRYLAGLLAGDRATCAAIVDGWLEMERPLRELYKGVFQRSLYEVGELWERGRITVADEHLATAMTESMISRVYPVLFKAPHVGRSAVVSCVANEYHQIGGKMVADTFELNGWDSYYLGANTPVGGLLELVKKKSPDVVALSAAVYCGLDTLMNALDALKTNVPNVTVWVGGQAFRWGGTDQLAAFPGVSLVESLADMESRLAAWGRTDG